MKQSLLNHYAALAAKARIALAIGQLAVAVPKIVMESIGEMLRRADHGRYLPIAGSVAARESVARTFNGLGIKVDASRCILGNGAKSLFSLAILAMTRPGDRVIWFTPGYPPYARAAEILGRESRAIRCSMPRCVPDLEQLRREILAAKAEARTPLLVVCNPSNPTGCLWGDDVLSRVAELVREHGCQVIADETYGDFVHAGVDFRPFATIPGMDTCTLTIRSGSKELAIPGYRLGYAAGTQAMVEQIAAIAGDISGCPNVFANAAALCLNQREAVVENSAKTLRRGREIVMEWLALTGCEYVPLDAAFFAWVRLPLPQGVSGMQATDQLLGEGVGLVPGEAFVASGDEESARGWFRITYAGDHDALRKGLAKIADLFL